MGARPRSFGPIQEALPDNARSPHLSPPTLLTPEGEEGMSSGWDRPGFQSMCCDSFMCLLRQVAQPRLAPHPLLPNRVTPACMVLKRHSQCRMGYSVGAYQVPMVWPHAFLPLPPQPQALLVNLETLQPQRLPMVCYMATSRGTCISI